MSELEIANLTIAKNSQLILELESQNSKMADELRKMAAKFEYGQSGRKNEHSIEPEDFSDAIAESSPNKRLALNLRAIEPDSNPLLEKMAEFTQRSQEEKNHLAQLHATISELRSKILEFEEKEKEHKKDLVLKTQAMI